MNTPEGKGTRVSFLICLSRLDVAGS